MDKQTNLTLAEDALYSFALRNLCEKFINLSDILYFYRYNPLSSSNYISYEMKLKDFDLVISKILELSYNYKTHPKLLKLYLSYLLHERKNTQHRKDKNTINLKDKINFWFCHKFLFYKTQIKSEIWDINISFSSVFILK